MGESHSFVLIHQITGLTCSGSSKEAWTDAGFRLGCALGLCPLGN